MTYNILSIIASEHSISVSNIILPGAIKEMTATQWSFKPLGYQRLCIFIVEQRFCVTKLKFLLVTTILKT